jgi:ATP-dependent protease ClpP protease subunit
MVILLHGDITPDTLEHVRSELEQDAGPVEVRIDSKGGDLLAGLSIYEELKARDTVVYVDGIAGSIASVIAFAGGQAPFISETGSIMIHNALVSQTGGNHNDLRQLADTLETYSDLVASVYEKYTSLDREQVKQLMDSETVISSSDAVEIGFANSVYHTRLIAKIENMNAFQKLINSTAPIKNEGDEEKEEKEEMVFSESQMAFISDMINKAIGATQSAQNKQVEDIKNQVAEAVLARFDQITSNEVAPVRGEIQEPAPVVNTWADRLNEIQTKRAAINHGIN